MVFLPYQQESIAEFPGKNIILFPPSTLTTELRYGSPGMPSIPKTHPSKRIIGDSFLSRYYPYVFLRFHKFLRIVKKIIERKKQQFHSVR